MVDQHTYRVTSPGRVTLVGVACGVMDQFAASLGQAGHALHVDTETLASAYVPAPDSLRVLVYHPGVPPERP